jgi:hypothetical protein
MTWLIVLEFPRPPKGLSANDRTPWPVKHRATQDVRRVVALKCRHIPRQERVSVRVTWVVGDRRRRDEDNLAPFTKAIYDGIGADRGISAGVVADDAPEFMVKQAPIIRYEKGCTPHFEVLIEAVSS